MPDTSPIFNQSPPIKVWVLAPYLETVDPNLEHYYDFTQSIAEYEKVFAELGIPWQWQPVTMTNFREKIDAIVSEKMVDHVTPVVFNICDGDEVNGTPGVSVVQYLEQNELIYTGADEFFYRITTSKIPMKEAFDEAGVQTPPWKAIYSTDVDYQQIIDEVGTTILVKPAVSGGSMGVGIKNVVHNASELESLVHEMFEGYRGWNLTADGLVAEKFIAGPEFTVLISGSFGSPDEAKIYTPVERVFHQSVKEEERFLSFDRLWEIYEDETPMPNDDHFYHYALPDPKIAEAVKQLSWDAYAAAKGRGYTRADVRMEQQTGRLYVLEVNAQCGLSEDEDYTSIGAILRFDQSTFTQLVAEIIADGLRRHNEMPEPVVIKTGTKL